jgi:hypothetical protein
VILVLPGVANATGTGFGLSKAEGIAVVFFIYVVVPVSIGFGVYKLLCWFLYPGSSEQPTTLKRLSLVILCLYLAWVTAGFVNS